MLIISHRFTDIRETEEIDLQRFLVIDISRIGSYEFL